MGGGSSSMGGGHSMGDPLTFQGRVVLYRYNVQLSCHELLEQIPRKKNNWMVSILSSYSTGEFSVSVYIRSMRSFIAVHFEASVL